VTDNAVPVFDYASYYNNPAPANTVMAATVSGNETISIPNPTVGSYVLSVLKPATGSNIAYTIKAVVTGVADTIPPVITLLGSNPLTIAQGAVYADAGATAVDNVDGNITANIVTVNSINTGAVGTYTVTYNVSDASGNTAAQMVRSVQVLANAVPTPVIASSGGGCAMLVNAPFDPTLMLLFLFALAFYVKRRMV